MAIFNRSKEKWVPTKPLNKVSKNRTIHFERDSLSGESPKAFKLNKRLWFWLDALSVDASDVYDFWYLNSNANGYEKTTLTHEGVDPTVENIRASRFFHKAVRFGYAGNEGYLQTGSAIGDLGELLFTEDGGGNYATVDSAVWISFWYKSPDRYPGTEPTHGHSIGGFVKNAPDNTSSFDDPHETKPVLGIYIDGTGHVSLRLSTPTAVAVPDIVASGTGDIYFAEASTSRTVLEGDWNYISICLPTSALNSGSGELLANISFRDLVRRARIWINGIEDRNLVVDDWDDFSADDALTAVSTDHYLVLGNSTGFWGSRDNDQCRPGVGFEGWIGDFTIMNQPSSNLDDVARFLYEAYRSGVHAVHSGTHSSEPLREIQELRTPRYYHPNNGGTDQHVLTTASGSMFEEGRNPSDPFDYDASKFFIQSEFLVPHMMMNHEDQMLQHWLSPDRSIFFEEDLQSPANGGFTIERQKIKTEDWLYPSHEQKQTVGPFNDVYIQHEDSSFDKTFTIDIPIGTGPTACNLGTDSVGEAPIFAGNTDTREYSGIIFPTELKVEITSNALVKFKIPFSAVSDQTYWVTTTDDNSGITYQKPNWFKFVGNEASSDIVTVEMPAEQLEGYLKIITFLKHCIQRYFVLNTDTVVNFWNAYIVDGSSVVRSFWADNPTFANLVLALIEIPDQFTSETIANQLSVTNLNETAIMKVIMLMKRQGDAIEIPQWQNPPNSDTLDTQVFNYFQIVEGNYVTMGDSSNGNVNSIGNYLLLPSEDYFLPLGIKVSSIFLEKLIHQYTQTNAASQFWYKSKIVTTFSPLYFSMEKISAGSIVAQNPNISMTTMAYHNFQTGEWEAVDSFGTTFQKSPDPSRFAEEATIGFSPMTSIYYPYSVDKLEEVVDSAGRPTDAFGFPFHTKYKSSAGQSFDLSSYFTEPVVLKGWELKMDVIPGVGPTAGSTMDWEVPKEDSYDAEGYNLSHANVVYNAKLPSPFVAFEKSSKQFGNTFPVRNSNGTMGRAVQSNLSQVTKGVTAFLLKESSTKTLGQSYDTYHRENHQYSYFSNCNPNNKNVEAVKGAELADVHDFDVGVNSIGNGVVLQLGPHRPLTQSQNFFANDDTRELLGYLQHVYHNDLGWDEETKYELRTPQKQELDFSSIGNSQTVNFENVWNRENQTYLSTIMGNTSVTKDFHVKGRMKVNSKLTRQSVVSPFFLRANTDTSADDGKLFYDIDTPSIASYQAFSHNYSIVNSWEGGTGTGDLVDGMFSIGVSGETLDDDWHVPFFNIPVRSTTSNVQKIPPLDKQMGLNPESDADVVLYPTDKLILGVQDSISTVIGSQVIDEDGNLWKWGRNHLGIPGNQTGAYLRLHLERQQQSKGIEPRSNQSHGFTADVNEGLGNTLFVDNYELDPLRVYSGSMADDVVVAAPSIPATAELKVQLSQFQADAAGAMLDPTGYVIPSFDEPLYRNYSGTQATDANGDVIPYPELRFNWIFLNEKCFKDRTPPAHVAAHTAEGTTSFYKKPNFMEIAAPTPTPDYQTNGVFAKLGALKVGLWPVTSSSTKINPTPQYVYQHVSDRYGGGCALWELNRNPNRTPPTTGVDKMTIDDNGNDFSFGPTEECPAFSSWSFRAVVPLFSTASSRVQFDKILFTVRLIALDRDDRPQVWNPETQAYQNLRGGDMFVFDAANVDPAKGDRPTLVYSAELDSQVGNWATHSYPGNSGAPDTILKCDVYCVVAEGHVRSGATLSNPAVYHFSSDAASNPTFNPWDNSRSLSWQKLMDNIASILEGDAQNIGGLHYTITKRNPAKEFFQINFVDDDYSIKLLNEVVSSMNQDLEFSLLDTSGDFGDPNGLPDDQLWVYRDGTFNNNVGYSNTSISNYGYRQFQEQVPQIGNDFLVKDINNSNENANLGPMMNNTYLRMTSPNSGGSHVVTGAPGDHAHTGMSVRIDYTNIPKKNAVSVVIGEARSEDTIGPLKLEPSRKATPERKVEFRTTEGTAGPYGSLSKFVKLVSTDRNDIILDSAPRNNLTVESGHVVFDNASKKVSLENPIHHDLCWPFVANPDNYRIGPLQVDGGVMIPGDDDGAGNVVLKLDPPANATDRRDAVLVNTDEKGSTVVFSTYDSKTDVELKDYILEKFPSSASKEKIVDDLSGGFGDGVSGKLVFRPSLYKYESFDANNGNLNGQDTHFFMKMDPVRGSRYGLYKTGLAYRAAIFSRKSYGQFKDFMYQGIDTSGPTLDSTIHGAPVRYSSKNPNDPRIDVDLGTNQRRNVDKYQRAYIPMQDLTGINVFDYGVTVPTEDQIREREEDWSQFTLPDGSTQNPETGDQRDSAGKKIEKVQKDPRLVVDLPGKIATSKVVKVGRIIDSAKRKK